MAASTLTHRLLIVWLILILRCVDHCALSIVNRACNHTDKRNGHIVLHLVGIWLAPLHLLQSVNSLKVHNIRECSIKARRLSAAVEVDHQLILSSHNSRAVVELRHSLVVAIHKVNLETLYAQL